MTAVLFLNSPLERLARAAVRKRHHRLVSSVVTYSRCPYVRYLSPDQRPLRWSSTPPTARWTGRTSSARYPPVRRSRRREIPLPACARRIARRCSQGLTPPSPNPQNSLPSIPLSTGQVGCSRTLHPPSCQGGTLHVSLS